MALRIELAKVVISLSLFGVMPILAGTLPYIADFESGELIKGDYLNFSGNAPVISTDFARAGRYSMKSVLNRKTSPTSYRTEASTNGLVSISPGKDYWYGFSIYLPTSYVPDNIWEIVAQWHNVPDTNLGESNENLNPPIGIHTGGGKWKVQTKWDSRVVTHKDNYEGIVTYDLGTYKTGAWTDWVFHIKWSPYSDGLLQIWKDGVKVVDKNGPVGYNDATGPFFKMGIYKGWKDRETPIGAVSVRTLYHDELRIAGPGSAYADVAPGNNSTVLRPAAPIDVVVN